MTLHHYPVASWSSGVRALSAIPLTVGLVLLTGCMGAQADRNAADREVTVKAVSRVLEIAGLDASDVTSKPIDCFGVFGDQSDRQASGSAKTRTDADPDRADEVLDAVLDEFDIVSDITDQRVSPKGERPAREIGFFAEIDGIKVAMIVRIAVDGMIRVDAETFC